MGGRGRRSVWLAAATAKAVPHVPVGALNIAARNPAPDNVQRARRLPRGLVLGLESETKSVDFLQSGIQVISVGLE